mgnify:CR=1 FL=1
MPYKLSLTQALTIVAALDDLTSKFILEPSRLEKGLRLYLEGKAQYRGDLGNWICQSSNGRDVYAVDLENVICTCPDSTQRESVCKHFIACWIANRVQTVLDAARKLLREQTKRAA